MVLLRLPVKTAVLSPVLPPAPSGQAIALYRLLRGFDPRDYCLLSAAPAILDIREAATEKLPCAYHRLPAAACWRRFAPGPVRLLRGWTNFLLSMVELPRRAHLIDRILRKEKCGAVVACSADPIDLPAGYLAAKRAHVPFFMYLMDDYETAWMSRLQKWFARRVMPWLVEGASGIIVSNEFLADAYRRRYALDPVVVRNVADPLLPRPAPAVTHGAPPAPWPREHGEIRIAYTGSIYDAHFDAIRNLTAALRSEDRFPFRLHLLTNFPPAVLPTHGITGPIHVHPATTLQRSLEFQRCADILFLPLAFHTPYPETIRTSAPGKMAEYLASGRPILVHAPADSFVSWYFRKFDCGMVVDHPDPAALAGALRQIVEDAPLREKLVQNARRRAETDFHPKTAQTTLMEVIGRQAQRADLLLQTSS